MSQRIHNGDIVKHFKRGTLSSNDLMYCYVVLDDNVMYTETGDRCVLYQALYGEHKKFCRPYDMFISEVDKEKYPDAQQIYRLEKIADSDLLASCKEVAKTLS